MALVSTDPSHFPLRRGAVCGFVALTVSAKIGDGSAAHPSSKSSTLPALSAALSAACNVGVRALVPGLPVEPAQPGR